MRPSFGGNFAEVRSLDDLMLFWPVTFMNVIGEKVKVAMKRNSIEESQILVLHDDLETKVGEIKL